MDKGLPDRPTDHAAASEPVVQRLVEAALTDRWRPALQVLYFHGSLLGLTEDLGLPVLVSARGDRSGLEHVTELLKAQTESGLRRAIRPWIKKILPRLIAAVQESGSSGSTRIPFEEVAGALGFRIDGSVGLQTPFLKEAVKKGFEDAVTFSGGIAALAFEFLFERRASYLTNVLPEPEYERMVECLFRLGLIEPQLEVSICPRCRNHYFVVATRPATPVACTQCGHEWVTVELFVFEGPFATLALSSSLLAVFSSAYVRERTHAASPILDADIYPLAEFHAEDDRNLEVDVYVPRSRLGLECKTFEDVFAPLTPNRLGSVVGKLTGQLAAYASIGIDEVAVATNLTRPAASRIESELRRKLAKQQVNLAHLEVIPGSPDKLLETLNQISDRLAERMNEDSGRSFAGRRRGTPSRAPRDDLPPPAEPNG